MLLDKPSHLVFLLWMAILLNLVKSYFWGIHIHSSSIYTISTEFVLLIYLPVGSVSPFHQVRPRGGHPSLQTQLPHWQRLS